MPVFASDPSSNLWHFTKHVEEGGAITLTVEMFDIKTPPPNAYHNSPNRSGLEFTAESQLHFHTGTNRPVGTRFTAGYYRGPVYTIRGAQAPFSTTESSGTNYVSIFTTGDRRQLIAAVDHGPIYTSTNSGLAWTIITTPGLYDFPLSTAADGSGFYAHLQAEQPPPVGTSASTNSPLAEWYAVAYSENGSKLVASASLLQPAPAMNIRFSANRVTIAWPAQYTTFGLEHTSDLASGKWEIVTSAVEVAGEENQVVLPPSMANDFFRLRGR